MPTALKYSSRARYPVIVVFDRQNGIGYRHAINTIDYLSANSAIPSAIVIGISFTDRQRYRWTLPGHREGEGENFMDVLLDELVEDPLLPADDFIFLVGHSRTAILSSYMLSRRSDKVNGIFAASPAFFDFGDKIQQESFEAFLGECPKSSKDYHYYFSVGSRANRDAHEEEARKLSEYLKAKLPIENFKHRFYFQPRGNHFTNYGLSVGEALVEAFSAYDHVLDACFRLLNPEIRSQKSLWASFEEVFQQYANVTGATYYPDLTFYNSIASAISNNQEMDPLQKNDLLIEILTRAIADHPKYTDFSAWRSKVKKAYDTGLDR